MKTYDIKIFKDNPVWEEATTLNIDEVYNTVDATITANAQIVVCKEAIRVHMWTHEPERKTSEGGPLGFPSEDSCLEFFFSPMQKDDRYFNIEFNSVGCGYIGFGSNINNLIRLHGSENECLIQPTIYTTDTSWEIYYDIPFELIRRFFPDFKVYNGKKIKANCYKCSELGNFPHYLCWSPVVKRKAAFHNSSCFGNMRFSEFFSEKS